MRSYFFSDVQSIIFIRQRSDPMGPLLQMGRIWITNEPPPFKRDDIFSDLVVTEDVLKRHSAKVEQSKAYSEEHIAEHNEETQEKSGLGGTVVGVMASMGRREPHDDADEYTRKRGHLPTTDAVTNASPVDPYSYVPPVAPIKRRLLDRSDQAGVLLRRDQPNGVPGRIDVEVCEHYSFVYRALTKLHVFRAP